MKLNAVVARVCKRATMRPRKPMQPFFLLRGVEPDRFIGRVFSRSGRVWPRCQSSTYARFRRQSRSPSC
ncbi:MAG: hypothetical protein QOJ04_4334 [Caballeronia sp.]|nr:hypothetical protein [Caballeronia sp.]